MGSSVKRRHLSNDSNQKMCLTGDRFADKAVRQSRADAADLAETKL
jgi:hypothetical protein